MPALWFEPIFGAGCGALIGLAVALVARRLSAGEAGRPLWLVVALETGLGAWAFSVANGVAGVSILLSAALLALALIDVAILRLPDAITFPLIAAGPIIAGLGGGDIVERVIGAATGYLCLALLAEGFRRLRGKRGLGLGDAKLLAAAGAWLGWRALPTTLLIACGLAFAWAGVRWLRQGQAALSQPLPFGAPLALGFWLIWLYGALPA